MISRDDIKKVLDTRDEVLKEAYEAGLTSDDLDNDDILETIYDKLRMD